MTTLTNTLIPQAPPLREVNGVLLVEGTRVPLDTIIYEYRKGSTADEIASAYDTVSIANVYAILSYYLKNREQVDAYLEERERLRAELRREIEAKHPITSAELRERLLERKRQREASGGQ